jgi:hypothetical protein
LKKPNNLKVVGIKQAKFHLPDAGLSTRKQKQNTGEAIVYRIYCARHHIDGLVGSMS